MKMSDVKSPGKQVKYEARQKTIDLEQQLLQLLHVI